MTTDQTMDKTPLDEQQRYLDSKLAELVVYAYDRAPTIKERFDSAGISPSKVKGIADLANLPVLRKDDLIELCKTRPPFGGLSTVPVEDLERIYVSPGPIYDPHHQSESFWNRHARIYKAIGWGKGDIVINTWTYHLVPAGLIFDKGLRRAGVTVVPMGTGNTELQVQVMHHLQVTGFYGTTGFFMNIIDKAEEMGYNITKDLNLKVVCIGGEMGGGPMRTIIEQKYGIATRDAYGTIDVGVFAFECSAKSGMHIADEVIVEIIDPETGKTLDAGEMGEVVATPIDEANPLIRFGTGDLATITFEPCQCGRTSPRLSHILGRIGDAVRTRGMFIHPREIEPALAQFSEIARYQAVVSRKDYRDELVLKVEIKDDRDVDKNKLAKKLEEVVTAAVRVRLDRIEFVAGGIIPEEHKLIVDERVY